MYTDNCIHCAPRAALLKQRRRGCFVFCGTNLPAKTNPGPAAQKRERTPGEKFAIATLEAIAELRGLPEETL